MLLQDEGLCEPFNTPRTAQMISDLQISPVLSWSIFQGYISVQVSEGSSPMVLVNMTLDKTIVKSCPCK